MVLYVDMSIGSPDLVFADLYSLTGQDGLGENNVLGHPDLSMITYGTPSTSSPVAARIKQLVDTAADIVISAVPSSYVLPNGAAISTAAGATFRDNTPPPPFVIRVIYDYEMCSGSGYWVAGETKPKIDMPRAIILYHELSHAWHLASGTIAATPAAEEIAAELDENIARTHFGEDTRLTTSHDGGCGSPTTKTPDWNLDCFIVAATMDQQEAKDQVDALRNFRDSVLRSTPVGLQFFERLYAEYYSYSPGLARHVVQDPALRAALREHLVLPLLDVCSWAARLVEQGPGPGPGLGTSEATLNRLLRENAFPAVPAPRRSPAELIQELVVTGLLDRDVAGRPYTSWALLQPVAFHAWLSDALSRRGYPVDRALVAEVDGRVQSWWARRPADMDAAQPGESLHTWAAAAWSFRRLLDEAGRA